MLDNNLINTLRQTPNKGRLHIFLGHPMSDGCDKTTVEPGNNFSPGVWTCGISVWIETGGEFYSPDLLDDGDVIWGFCDQGFPPILESKYTIGSHLSITNRLAHLGDNGAEGIDYCDVTLTSYIKQAVSLYVVVRDVGPAGGKIDTMEYHQTKNLLLINRSIHLTVEQPVTEFKILPPDGKHDSHLGILHFHLELEPEARQSLCFRLEHGFSNRVFVSEIPRRRLYTELTVGEGLEMARLAWREQLPGRVFAPDLRIANVWERYAFHILSAMECGLPRVGAVNYPFFWMRDGVIILRALDIIGRHDLARLGCETIAPLVFSGGFGAEADAPGEGIWALVAHARITRDNTWLSEVFPEIAKRVAWLEKMLTAQQPVRVVGENRLPVYTNTPGVNLLCLAAQNGCIHGRMDWHTPDFFINAWAECGLRNAAEAARRLGFLEIAEQWLVLANRLSLDVVNYLLPKFGNERDPAVVPYPSGALLDYQDSIRMKFRDWYIANRLTDDGRRKPEPLWTYFEAAHIHNAIQLGFKELAWKNLDGLLASDGSPWQVSAYCEGLPGGNEYLPYNNAEARRGWLDPKKALGGNMPHNWTSAEIINLIRTIFICEEGENLVLGKGVPDAWLIPGSTFGVTKLPTDYGLVSYTARVAENGKIDLDYRGPENYIAEFARK